MPSQQSNKYWEEIIKIKRAIRFGTIISTIIRKTIVNTCTDTISVLALALPAYNNKYPNSVIFASRN